jgi:glutamine amidotransferase
MSIPAEVSIAAYGMGNLGSIQNMIRKLGHRSRLCTTADEIRTATKLILPGVGHFGRGMENLQRLGLMTALHEKVLGEKVPVLGICLGMQLMAKSSEEGAEIPGLGWIDAAFVRFRAERADRRITVPHMGWNELVLRKPSRLFDESSGTQRFYFVHSYYAECRHDGDVLAETDYGYRIVAAYERENIFGVQFHPEKSHRFGMSLMKNFLERC